MVDDLLCGDLAGSERVEEVMSEILTAEQVAEFWYHGNIVALKQSHEALRAENERISVLHEEQYEDSMIAHRFMEKFLTEFVRGYNFSVKVPLMEESIAELRAENERLKVENAALQKDADEYFTEIMDHSFIMAYVKSVTRHVAGGKGIAMEGEFDALMTDVRRLATVDIADSKKLGSLRARIAELEKELDAARYLLELALKNGDDFLSERDDANKEVDAAIAERDAARHLLDSVMYNGAQVMAERDGLRRAIESMAAPCIEWMVSKNGADWEKRISFIAGNYVEKMVFGIASTGKRALAAVPAPVCRDSLHTEFSCSICGSPAEFIKSEGIYRHKGHPGDLRYAAQSFCDKYGYPIQVVTAVPAPALADNGGVL